MLNGGIIDLGLFLCPYVLPPGDQGAGWSFHVNSHEPLITSFDGLGSPTAKVIAPAAFDYGIINDLYIHLGDDNTAYDGEIICRANAFSGHFGDNGHIQFQTWALAPAGAVEGKTQSNVYVQTAMFESDLPYTTAYAPGSPDGYILKTLALGPSGFADSHLQPINFAFPYTQYGYFQAFISTPSFGSNFDVSNPGVMLGVGSFANFGEYQGGSRTNMQGLFMSPTGEPYPSRGLYFSWSGPFSPWANSAYVEGLNEAGGRDLSNQGFNTFIPDPVGDDAFYQAWYSNNFRTSRNWFMVLGPQVFDGQPQTPYLVDVKNQLYYAIRLHGNSPEANALIASNNGGMDFAFSEKQGSMFFTNMGLSEQYIFNTIPLNLNLARPYGQLPTLKLPCYNPCIPSIIAGPQP